MRTIFLTLITAFFSISAWAHTPGTAATSHPSSSAAPATVDEGYEVEERSSLSGSSTGWTDRNEVPAAESERLSGQSSLSGSSTTVPYGNTMNDQDKALEMCESLNPDRNCTDVVKSCRGQADLESCMQRNAQ